MEITWGVTHLGSLLALVAVPTLLADSGGRPVGFAGGRIGKKLVPERASPAPAP
ncbi:hypothetical protein Spla01_02435 [Streptomyces platensis]|uniref:Uncharacterized protein n=1 Tax=Streptomyces platensis TaxID=58346 RepID=A0ABX3XSD3_STRPT|nr:hypothetical protein BG653_05046 [Streptomyces platensis]